MDYETIIYWLTLYGGPALMVMLALGIVGLPIPDETLMIATGILIHKHVLSLPFALFFAYAGAFSGITLSYFIGYWAGKHLVIKYGGWVGITRIKLEKCKQWFKRYGKFLLIIGYFIPIVRHLIGISAGISKLEFKQFALYAYSGVFLWASIFILLGYSIGGQSTHSYEDFLYLVGIGVLVLGGVYFLVRKMK